MGAKAGGRLRKDVTTEGSVRKVETNLPSPAPREYLDMGSGEKDGPMTPGSIGTVSGRRLKFDPGRQEEGLYLVPVDGGDEVKVEVVQRNMPAQIVFLVPPEASGAYYLEVRARPNRGTDLRTGRLDAALTA